MPPSDVFAYIDSRLRASATVEAATAVVTAHAVRSAGPSELESSLSRIEREWVARTPVLDVRKVSRGLGRGLLRFSRVLFPSADQRRRLDALPVLPPRAMVTGTFAALAGISAHDLVRSVFYDEAMAVVTAYLKLAPADPSTVISGAVQICADHESRIESLVEVRDPRSIPSSSAPLHELWAFQHSRRKQRLYRA
ncbi:urease accessory UreF family protein [Microbacterium sp. NPDC087589]|uniref:urease accessory UreF family protein n=1 Tax=Microbacterium sp. NPDC087589 TaxID=3364191 RepID=UPI0037F4B960